jgi:hypothetical protein
MSSSVWRTECWFDIERRGLAREGESIRAPCQAGGRIAARQLRHAARLLRRGAGLGKGVIPLP